MKLMAGVLFTAITGWSAPVSLALPQDSTSPKTSQQTPATSSGTAPTSTEGSPFAVARRLAQKGKFAEALAQLEAVAATKPEMKGLAHEMGLVQYKKADYLKAVASFKKALEEDSNDNEAVQLMGISYYLAGRPGEAIPLLEKVQTWYRRCECGRRVHPGNLLYPDERLSACSPGVCENVRG